MVIVHRHINAFRGLQTVVKTNTIHWLERYYSEASAAPLALQADRINRTTSSTPTPFLICANKVGPPSLIFSPDVRRITSSLLHLAP